MIKFDELEIINGRVIGIPFDPARCSGKKMKPTGIVIHYTAGGSRESTVNWFKDQNCGVSAHFVIGRDGSITQMVELDTIAFHAGNSKLNVDGDTVRGFNNFSIGIEIANYGLLEKM